MSSRKITYRFGQSSLTAEESLADIDIHFQPICEVDEEPVIIGFEALGRKTSIIGTQSIAPYIDEIHAMGLRPELELRTLEKACRFLQDCDRMLQTDQANNLYVTVNLHPLTLMQPDLLQEIDKAIASYPAARSRIRFEILEHEFPEGTEDQILENVMTLNESGYRLYLDDYGDHPGQDEDRLETMKPFIHGIKLSGSLWQRSSEGQESLLDYVASPDLSDKVIIVEGIEDDEQLERVKALQDLYGFDRVLGQGWHPSLGASLSHADAILRLQEQTLSVPLKEYN
ncbi:MAG: EAL domain-containing protein [Alphaproteobacteria bacterium]|nr:EAL domain-containing protein [Alphaproteobacteria bacterium]